MIRCDDMVELSRRLILLSPRTAAVEGHVRATVVALDHPLRVVGRDPQIVVISVRYLNVPERFAVVGRAVHPGVQHVHRVHVLRISEYSRVVPRTLAQPAIAVRARPRCSSVHGPVDASGVGFDNGPHMTRVYRRHGESDVTYHTLGQARVSCDFRPMLSAVGGLEDPAPRAAGNELPWRPPRLPEGGVNGLGILWIQNQIGDARRVVSVQNLSPAFAAVGGLEDAALAVRTKDVAGRSDVDDVGIGRMHTHSRYLPRISQAERGPGLSCVASAPDAIAVGYVAANRIFAATDINDIRVRLTDADRADRSAEILVGDGRPGDSAIGRLEYAAARGAEVVLI